MVIGTSAGVGVAAGVVLSAALFYSGSPEWAYAAFVAAFAVFCFGTTLSLNWQILVGTLLGLLFGAYFGEAAGAMGIVGRVFIFMLKMMIALTIRRTWAESWNRSSR